MLAFSHKNIIKLRYYKDIISVLDEEEKLIKKLKLKYVLYFGMTIFLICCSFIILLLFALFIP